MNNTSNRVSLIQNPPLVFKVLSGSLEHFINHLISGTEMVQNQFGVHNPLCGD